MVRRGDSLQAALNAARPGDTLLLEPGAEFVGNFVLPVKEGTQAVVVRSVHSAGLPSGGTRIAPAHAPLLARLRSPNNAAALRTAPGAHHWELRYLEFAANQGGYGDIIQLGDGSSAQNSAHLVPHTLLLSHLYIHGDPLLGQKRGIALNAAAVTIRDSYISDIKGVGIDTQAIGGWNGPGPYVIENNYLEAAGENVLFGGADPAIPGLVPDGITFRRNHVARPWAWRAPILQAPTGLAAAATPGGALLAGAHTYRVVARRAVGQGTIGRSAASAEVTAVVPTDGSTVQISWEAVATATEYRVYGRTAGAQNAFWTVTGTSFTDDGRAGGAGTPAGAATVWSVKNLFELKNARNVVVEGNLFENHWKESQPGYAIVLTPRNQGGACTWCVVEFVRFENNLVRHVAAGINLLGTDSASRPTQRTNGILIRNNVFADMRTTYGGNAWFLLIGDGPADVVVDHNTIAHDGNTLVYLYGGTALSPRLVENARVTNNAAPHGTYGINGEHFSFGNGVISGFIRGTVSGNFLAGGSAARYPAGNRFGSSFEEQFVSASSGDFRLRDSSSLRGAATDGGDIGADVGTLLAALAGGPTSEPPPTPPPPPPARLRVVTGP